MMVNVWQRHIEGKEEREEDGGHRNVDGASDGTRTRANKSVQESGAQIQRGLQSQRGGRMRSAWSHEGRDCPQVWDTHQRDVPLGGSDETGTCECEPATRAADHGLSAQQRPSGWA